LTSAASLQATREVSVELPKSFQLKRPHRRVRLGHGAVSSVLGTLSRRKDDYDERSVASTHKGKLPRAA
jgi:hypothetical protein